MKKIKVSLSGKNKVFLFLVFLIAGLGVFFCQNQNAQAATFYWEQDSWTGLPVATLFVHAPINSITSGWSGYSAKDDNADITSGDVTISLETTALTETSTDPDFSDGTSVGTLTTGEEVKLDLP